MARVMKAKLWKIPVRIETRRLVLQVPRTSDAPDLNGAIRSSFGELHPWVPWAKRCPTIAATKRSCAIATRVFRAGKEFPFLIRLKVDRSVIGGAGLAHGDLSVPRFEIGYWLRSDCVGQGYATETVTALERIARKYLKVRRLELRIDPDNTRSIAVARRAGYRLEAVLHHDSRDNRGQLRNTQIFAKLF
jgi:RimJ/RimL family protein N-acetyltransferase